MRVTQRWSRRLAIYFRKSWCCAVVIAGVLWALALTPTAATGQGVVNPTTVQFESADHDATLVDGSPKVSRYDLAIYLQGASAPLTTVDLGRGTKRPDGRIEATPAELLGLPVGQVFEARVVAIGPGGSSSSDPSNPFERPGPPATPTAVTLGSS